MQVARSDMSDLEWEFIKAVLPNKTRGKKRVDDRRVINGIFYVLRTGIPWADLPSEYGPPTTVYNRFNRWSYAGHWDRIMDAFADAPRLGLSDPYPPAGRPDNSWSACAGRKMCRTAPACDRSADRPGVGFHNHGYGSQ